MSRIKGWRKIRFDKLGKECAWYSRYHPENIIRLEKGKRGWIVVYPSGGTLIFEKRTPAYNYILNWMKKHPEG